MSPPSDNVPRTPDRRSSTHALFTAFRTLTGGRLKSPTPPLSTSSATCTPARTPSLSAVRPASVASPHSADGTLQRISRISQRSGQPIAGGPPELDELVTQVEQTHAFSERAVAVDKICTVLEEYPVQGVLGLWSAASDLLLPEQPDEVAQAGYKLLRACASLTHLTTLERHVFFDAASLRKNDRSFGKRLQVIVALTKGGRDVEACESFIVPFILKSLDTCFKASLDAANVHRKANAKRNIDKPPQEALDLARLYEYANDICKFSAKIFTDDDLEMLLTKAMTICQETTQTIDMENSIKLFDTVITYVHVPTAVLRLCVEVMCAIHRQIAALQDQTWNTLCNLFRSHVGGTAISSLLHTLHDGPQKNGRQSNKLKGALQILQMLLMEDGRNGLPVVSMSLLIPTLKGSIRQPHQMQEEQVLSFVDAILDHENLRKLLLTDSDLADLLAILRTCAERDDDRHRAKLAGDETSQNGTSSNHPRSADEHAEPDIPLSPTSLRMQNHRRDPENILFRVLVKLDDSREELDYVQKEGVMELLLHQSHLVGDSGSERMIQYFANERYMNPSNSEWLQVCRAIVDGVLKDTTRPRSLRILAIQSLRETYDTVEKLCSQDLVHRCRDLLFEQLQAEIDVEILSELVDFTVDVADRTDLADFQDIVKLLTKCLSRPKATGASNLNMWSTHPLVTKTDDRFGSACNVIASAFVRLFTRSVIGAAQKTRILYETVRAIAGNDKYDNDARLTALKLLFRLRADSRYALTVSPTSEGERIAAELCRTEDTAILPDKIEEAMSPEHGRSEDGSWREYRKTSGSSPHASVNRHTGRTTPATGRVSRPIPPLWMYPGPKGLPEKPSPASSRVVFSHIDASQYPLSDDIHDMEITLWLELIISLLQKPPDWEIYSYVLVHLGPQLSNQALVRSCVVQLRMLRNVLCEQVRNASFHEPPPHTLLKKADVAVCLFHILTVILSYHEYFEKSEEDDLVKAFLQGITQWDRTSKWCIHALSVCCFEIPLSVSKSLDSIVQKMSQIITKPATAIHILEFLTSLARLPELYKNFREDEFKTVFGVCFRYLQHIRDQRERAQHVVSLQGGGRALRHSGPSKDLGAKRRTAEDDLPQYLYSLAYHVITFWFMALKLEDRGKQIPWITRNLYHTESNGRVVMEEQGEVILDILNMVAYTDRDQTVRDEQFAQPGDGEVWKKTWIVGNSFVTLETAARTGASLVTTRRPCGTRYLSTRPLITSSPEHQVPMTAGLASEAFYSNSYVGILPDDIFQSFYSPLNLSNPPIALPDDDMTRRAITSFDRIATVDNYKVGVIYIGDGQTDEREIFKNNIGSPAYTSFVSDLGTLCRLKDAKFNTGGLDTRDDADGEYTMCWRDRCIELVFHITTMMPTHRDDDMTYPNKKRHIGNDFVNIIFNDSGLPYNFDTFPSAFNYVHIVISPESRASFVDRRLDADLDGKNRYYKVQAISRADFPDVSPAVETKIICGKYLAGYCRLIAINACVFSSVWFIREGGESISSWRNRLREIKRLRERYGAVDTDLKPTSSPSSPSQSHGLSSPPIREQNGISPFQRMSIATYVTEGTSRSSISSSSHDQT